VHGVPDSDSTITLMGLDFTHSDVLNALNHHSETTPSSAPSAFVGAGLPCKYKKANTYISGCVSMAKHILKYEGTNGELSMMLE